MLPRSDQTVGGAASIQYAGRCFICNDADAGYRADERGGI